MRSYYFTMKINSETLPNLWGYVEVKANNGADARDRMVAKYGLAWGFEYDTLEEVHPLDRHLIEIIE